MTLSRTIVVVENESLLRDLIARSLEAAGFQVSTAANAADARRAVKASDPDACVVDIELGPGPNGFDFAEFLGRDSPDVGVVFLTNLPDPRFAIKHGKAENVSLRVFRVDPYRLAVEVTDDGQGLPPGAKPGFGSKLLTELSLSWKQTRVSDKTVSYAEIVLGQEI